MKHWMKAAGSLAALVASGVMLAGASAEPRVSSEPASSSEPIDVEALERLGAEVGIDFGALAALAMNARPTPRRSNDGLADWKTLSEGFEKVISTADGDSFYGLWVNGQTNDVLAELPRGFQRQRHFFAMTVAGGELFAGLQAGDLYVYWKQFGKDRLALIAPQVRVRSSGDQESRDSVEMIFTDRVLLDVPILAMGPSGQPVIDLDELLVGMASEFFGRRAAGLQKRLAEIDRAKAFPENVEVAFKAPDRVGDIKTFHYSISLIEGTRGFKPRKADTRVGYFTTTYRDLGQFDWDDVDVRYINRWHLEKADPKLNMSPPKEPIIFYVEHTVPVRYRRWVREGIDYWNKAFEQVGIDGAIEVRFQDKSTRQHMEKDPEDVRYNFIRWLSNDIATAIGPSRVNPLTGEILDADVILTDGWIRVYTYRWDELLPQLAMEGFGPELTTWLQRNPRWDPRVRMVSSGQRERLLAQRRAGIGTTTNPLGYELIGDPTLIGDDPLDGLAGRVSQVSGRCDAAIGKAMSLATARVMLDALGPLGPMFVAAQADAEELPEIPEDQLETIRKLMEERPELLAILPEKFRDRLQELLAEKEKDEEEPAEDEEAAEEEEPKPEPKPTTKPDPEVNLDGMPESFVGPMLAELVAHEVGHTLGLRHNFKGSAAYALEDINSEEFKGERPWSASVMDYNGINIVMPAGCGNGGCGGCSEDKETTPESERDAPEDEAGVNGAAAEGQDHASCSASGCGGCGPLKGFMQGDFSPIDIGPYDLWAIEYGYTFDNPEKVLKRVAEPELQYGTDEDAWGPDPLVRRWDVSADPLEWAENQMNLARFIRDTLLDGFVEEGDSWSRARKGYQISLGQHVSAVSVAANWVGGAHVYRDKKGDPGGRAPIEVVDAAEQRRALRFVINNTFYDEAYGLTPEILRHLTIDKWWDEGGFFSIFKDPNYDVHDTVLSIQSAAMTMVLNPMTLRRVLDNEVFVPSDQDSFTMAELLREVTSAAWTELNQPVEGSFCEREPMISSLRRNLQREHLERLIDLAIPGEMYAAADKPIATLATMHLRELRTKIDKTLKRNEEKLDDYSRAHLEESDLRVARVLDAQYIYNTDDISGGGFVFPFFQEGQQQQPR